MEEESLEFLAEEISQLSSFGTFSAEDLQRLFSSDASEGELFKLCKKMCNEITTLRGSASVPKLDVKRKGRFRKDLELFVLQEYGVSLADLTGEKIGEYLTNEQKLSVLEHLQYKVKTERILATLSKRWKEKSEQSDNDGGAHPFEGRRWALQLLSDTFELGESASVETILAEAKDKISKALVTDGEDWANPALDPKELSPAQLGMIKEIDETYRMDYAARKDVLLTRVKVTYGSFLQKIGSESDVQEGAQAALRSLKASCSVAVNDLFCANVFALGQTLGSGQVNRTTRKSFLKAHLIERVPDRGGRVEEIRRSEFSDAVRSANAYMRGGPAAAGRGRGRGRGREGEHSHHHKEKGREHSQTERESTSGEREKEKGRERGRGRGAPSWSEEKATREEYSRGSDRGHSDGKGRGGGGDQTRRDPDRQSKKQKSRDAIKLSKGIAKTAKDS